MGAVPVLARGLGHTVPTYLRRRPGSPSNGFLGSALDVSRVANDLMTTLADPKAYLRNSALSRRRMLDPKTRQAFSARLVDLTSRDKDETEEAELPISDISERNPSTEAAFCR